jgi:two-component system, OmpR family, copper resistance phosphate regulon response regulator CusR
MRILLLEDEPQTAAYLHKGLSESGFVVDVARTGKDGLLMARLHPYDLIILDIILPDLNGWSVLESLHSSNIRVPVFFLTCRDSVVDKVRGLELGAEDYLVKPFAFSELLARVRAILRRGPERHADIIRIADLEIDLGRQRASRGGQQLDLRPKEFAILVALARKVGHPLSRTMLVDTVWEASFDFETNVVDVQIKRLREKVDLPFGQPLIHTVRGVGYVLELRP